MHPIIIWPVPNVFRSGAACIDNWIIFTSSLLTVAEKLIMDMIHNPVVTRYESMANPYMEDWHRAHVASGRVSDDPPAAGLRAGYTAAAEKKQNSRKKPRLVHYPEGGIVDMEKKKQDVPVRMPPRRVEPPRMFPVLNPDRIMAIIEAQCGDVHIAKTIWRGRQ